MSTTLRFDSFVNSNLRERTELTAAVAAGATTITVGSTEGYAANDIIYVGTLGREKCEKAVVQAVTNATTLTLTSGLAYAHTSFESVVSVVGDRIRIYRAPNVDGTIPADASFTVYATRSIDPDQVNTFYTDSSGSASYWYRHTYFNETSLVETELDEFDAVRGDDYAPYATNDEIRRAAGFENATNLKDSAVDQQRRIAESEINTALGGAYQVPFTKPVPQVIRTVTIQLAAGLLLLQAYSGSSSLGDRMVKDARAALAGLKLGDSLLPTDEVTSLTDGGVSSWPDDSTASTSISEGGGERIFSVGDRY